METGAIPFACPSSTENLGAREQHHSHRHSFHNPSSDAIFFYDERAQSKFQQEKPGPMIITTSTALRSPLLPSSRWWFTRALVAPLRSWGLCRAKPMVMLSSSWALLLCLLKEPFLAVVTDPTRTVSAGEVDIGAFRSYPDGYKPPDDPVSEYQNIPLNKIEDVVVYCKQYNALNITFFKSSLYSHLMELLWNKYWVNTLSSSPLLGNGDYVAGQILHLAEKLEQAVNQLAHSRFGPLVAPPQRKKDASIIDLLCLLQRIF